MASIANAFALLSAGDDAADVDIGALVAAAPVAKKEAPAPVAEEPKGARPASAGARGGRGEAVAGRGNGRGGRGAGRGPRHAPRGDDAPSFDAESAPSARGRGERTGGRGRGGRGGARPGKREYDRQDGTGRGHETEKRHGGGAHNWGEEGKDETEAAAEQAQGQEEAAVEAVEEAPAAEPEEEEKQMTLEEYEAVLAEKRAGLNQQKESAFKADEKQFSGMKTFEKVEEDVGLSLTKNAKVIGANKAGREKERKEKELVTDVGFRITSDTDFRPRGEGRGRGGRGGRGEGRGRGGRGEGRGRGGFSGRGGRGGRGGSAAGGPTLDLESAFPALA